MIRPAAALAAAVSSLAAILTAPTAEAALPPISGGAYIENSDGSACTVSFADPIRSDIIYTAAHCYSPAGNEIRYANRRAGRYRPDVFYRKDIDLVAIQLYKGITSAYTQCLIDGCHRLGTPAVVHAGDQVCKWGSTTAQTCGTVLQVWDHEFSTRMHVEPGDSGSPVYQVDPDTGTVNLVGVVDSRSERDNSIAYATNITTIQARLGQTWGPAWQMY